MTTIGILGTGRMGVRLALLFAQTGNQVLLASRDVARAQRITDSLDHPNLRPATYSEALTAPVIVPSIFVRDGLLDELVTWKTQLAGKLLIDITNPFNDDYSDFILPWDTSSAEQIQHRLPETKVVGAFKNVWWEVFDQPQFGTEISDVYVVSDHPEAKQVFFKLVEGSSFRYVDAGRLANARTVERMTLLSGEMGQRLGIKPRLNYKLLGTPWEVGRGNPELDALIAR
ncbi:MAG TPA: NAD(P)-binding domain-containing protein [Acidobacteriota bacterium]|nr:NAD(P)-binding domain-containing protein [Acidobacteriota bacterium]HNG93607.1 NAD(P)-binding domain-containing protein [Acidobacteriota bacterium]